MANDPRFALAGVTLAEMDDLFGVWEVSHVAAAAVEGPAETTWRVELPGALDEAGSVLEQKRLALSRSESSLVEAERRLGRVVAGVGVSYNVPGGQGDGRRITGWGQGAQTQVWQEQEGVWGEPEAELLRAVQALEAPVSFAADWREDAERREVFRRWRAFLHQVRRVVSHYARVETAMEGALVGRTTVGWTGDFEIRWEPGATRRSMVLHHEAVQLALGSRLALVRLLIVVGTGAARLALRLTVPGAQLLVLPAVWKFVRDVMQELRGRQWGSAHVC